MKFYPILLCIAVVGLSAFGQAPLTGMYKTQLRGPVTQQVLQQARSEARKSLETDVQNILYHELGFVLDTTNSIELQHWEVFLDMCVKRAKEDSRFSAATWIFTLGLPQNKLKEALIAHNATYDALAKSSFAAMQSAQQSGNLKTVFENAVKTIFYGKAHLGTPVADPANGQTSLVARAQEVLTKLSDAMKIDISEMMIQGKPGTHPAPAPKCKVTINQKPFPGIGLNGYLPDGTLTLSAITNEQGIIDMTSYRVPYVANGTFLYIRLNPASIIGETTWFPLADLGVANLPEQVMMFKVTKPRAVLRYSAKSASENKIAQSITSPGFLKTYLADTCHLQMVVPSEPHDLIVEVQLQFTDYTYDKTEIRELKLEGFLKIIETSVTPARTPEKVFVYKKEFDALKPIEDGLFFWEAAKELKKQTRNLLLSL